MKDYSFSFEELDRFSNSDPYNFVPKHYSSLLRELNHCEKSLNFPAIKNDVGQLLAFFFSVQRPKRVFEMGSGYGHSAFWYFLGANETLEEVILTEKRTDLESVFNQLPWPVNWKNRMSYIQGDAFNALDELNRPADFFLVDGVKADYLRFIKLALPKLSSDGLIAIDNSYWRGSFLNASVRAKKKSAQSIHELHTWIGNQKNLKSIFVPFLDGLTLIKKL
ncbi:MAG: hypothetical protein CME64_12745 [Halobacteriovoraceae bacterium]|nr:hypothetical protein [Halobacteriovoraceae bacterium]|tara:strand:- start:144761 stop:145423 length:663 start_codon:yes stop_codon:yes gene_type:complete